MLQPLLAALVFTLVFDRAVGVASDGSPIPYSSSPGWSSGSTSPRPWKLRRCHWRQSRELVTKVYFPRLLAPLASVLPGLVDLVLSLGVVAIFMVIYERRALRRDPPRARLDPGGDLRRLAVGIWLAALNVLYRDVRYTLNFMLQIWFFASPVVFPGSLISGGWQYLFYANPMAGSSTASAGPCSAGPPRPGRL